MAAYVPTHWWQHLALILGHIKFVVLVVYTVVVYDAQHLCGSLNSPMALETYLYTNIHYSLLHLWKCTMQWLAYPPNIQNSPLVPTHFYQPKKELHTYLQWVQIPSCLRSPATTNLLSIYVDLSIIDISNKWNYGIYGLLNLNLFHIMFSRFMQIVACNSTSFPFCCILNHHMDILYFVIH